MGAHSTCPGAPEKRSRLEGGPCGDTERRRPSIHPGERPRELELGLPASRTVREGTPV